jgi:hypothetical protein
MYLRKTINGPAAARVLKGTDNARLPAEEARMWRTWTYGLWVSVLKQEPGEGRAGDGADTND